MTNKHINKNKDIQKTITVFYAAKDVNYVVLIVVYIAIVSVFVNCF